METKAAEPLSREAGISWLVSRIRPRAGRTLVGIDGVDGAGKTTFADDLATELVDSGLTVIRISLDDFLNPAEVRHAQGRTSPEGFLADTYDYQRFIEDVLEPLGSDGSGRYRDRSYDLPTESPVTPPWQVAPDAAVVIVDLTVNQQLTNTLLLPGVLFVAAVLGLHVAIRLTALRRRPVDLADRGAAQYCRYRPDLPHRPVEG